MTNFINVIHLDLSEFFYTSALLISDGSDAEPRYPAYNEALVECVLDVGLWLA